MKINYFVESINMLGPNLLKLDKGKERAEFEALATLIVSHLGAGNLNYSPKCFPDVPDPCTGRIPEPPPPTCVQGNNPHAV